MFGLTAVTVAAFALTLVLAQLGPGGFQLDDGETERVTVEAVPPEGTAEIMVVGDSLAQGSAGDYTWRYWLWTHLNDEAEQDVGFVGPHDDLFSLAGGEGAAEAYAEPDFDTAHASVWGTTVERLGDEIGEQVAEYEPDYVLVMAGVNDLFAGYDAPELGQRVADLVSTARVARGDVQFVIAELLPVWGTDRDSRLNEEITHFNSALPNLAAELTGEDSPVTVARVAEDYAPAEDHWDPVHPNANGELKIAAAFADTLAEDLNLGVPYPRPLPELPLGPRTAPEVTAEADPEDDTSVRLSWDPVPGATSYQVVQRRESPDPDDPVTVPGAITGVSDGPRGLRVENLLAGATYSFTVRTMKGEDEGESADVRVEVEVDPPAAPETPELFSEGGANQVLEWNEVADATHYGVWRRALDCAAGSGASTDCEPVDDAGPEGDPDGWEAVTVAEEAHWEVDAAGAAGYEFLVRSHRDFVEGGFSASVAGADG